MTNEPAHSKNQPPGCQVSGSDSRHVPCSPLLGQGGAEAGRIPASDFDSMSSAPGHSALLLPLGGMVLSKGVWLHAGASVPVLLSVFSPVLTGKCRNPPKPSQENSLGGKRKCAPHFLALEQGFSTWPPDCWGLGNFVFGEGVVSCAMLKTWPHPWLLPTRCQ